MDPITMGFGPYEEDSSEKIINALPRTLEEAVLNLKKDSEYLKRWGIFPEALLNKWIQKKLEEQAFVASVTHPVEYQMYFDL